MALVHWLLARRMLLMPFMAGMERGLERRAVR